jgi:hypothetical protein
MSLAFHLMENKLTQPYTIRKKPLSFFAASLTAGKTWADGTWFSHFMMAITINHFI